MQVTAFLPTNDAWNGLSPDDYHFWVNRDRLTYVFRHHIVEGGLDFYVKIFKLVL